MDETTTGHNPLAGVTAVLRALPSAYTRAVGGAGDDPEVPSDQPEAKQDETRRLTEEVERLSSDLEADHLGTEALVKRIRLLETMLRRLTRACDHILEMDGDFAEIEAVTEAWHQEDPERQG